MTTCIQDRLMPVDMLTWNPRGCLVSVIDDPAEAGRAVMALHEAGFTDDDVRLASARELVAIGDSPPGRSLFARIVGRIGALGDESIVAAGYLHEARCGHHLLIVYALRADLKRRAYAVVTRHRAHTIQYYGRWVMSDQM